MYIIKTQGKHLRCIPGLTDAAPSGLSCLIRGLNVGLKSRLCQIIPPLQGAFYFHYLNQRMHLWCNLGLTDATLQGSLV